MFIEGTPRTRKGSCLILYWKLMVVYHFQKVSGNVPLKSILDTTSVWVRVWVVPAENFQEQRTSWKGSRVSFTESSVRKYVFHFFKAIFDTSFIYLCGRFFGKWNRFVQMVDSGILWRNLPVLNFAYHSPKPWTDRPLYVNGKQPMALSWVWLLVLDQSIINQSFILTRYVKELKKLVQNTNVYK